MGGRAGDDFDLAKIHKPLESLHKIPAIVIHEGIPDPKKPGVIHTGQIMEGGFSFGPLHLLPYKLDERVQPVEITGLQQGVAQHGNKGGGHGKGKAEVYPVLYEFVQHLEERDITLRDRLVEPVLLEGKGVFRVPDIREVSMKNKGQVTDFQVWSHGEWVP